MNATEIKELAEKNGCTTRVGAITQNLVVEPEFEMVLNDTGESVKVMSLMFHRGSSGLVLIRDRGWVKPETLSPKPE